jgi:hypothetical protein
MSIVEYFREKRPHAVRMCEGYGVVVFSNKDGESFDTGGCTLGAFKELEGGVVVIENALGGRVGFVPDIEPDNLYFVTDVGKTRMRVYTRRANTTRLKKSANTLYDVLIDPQREESQSLLELLPPAVQMWSGLPELLYHWKPKEDCE